MNAITICYVRDLLVLLGNARKHARHCIAQKGSLVFLWGERRLQLLTSLDKNDV